MVNKKGGKKHKRNKKQYNEIKQTRFKEDGQEYAQIKKCKGNCRFNVKCFDGKDRDAILCGTMRKRKFVNLMDIVLVSLRDFEDKKCDIIDLYDNNQVNELKSLKEIPDTIKLEEENDYMDDTEIYFSMDISEDEIEDDSENKEDEIVNDYYDDDPKEKEDIENYKINMDDI